MFSEVSDHNGLIPFYKANGLEVSDDITCDDGAVFSIKCVENGEIISAATLSFRFGVYILDYVAVDLLKRQNGLGETAVCTIIEKSKNLGADKLYITAKNPKFFTRLGFREGSPDGVDMNADCLGCPEFQNGCTKLPMYFEIV